MNTEEEERWKRIIDAPCYEVSTYGRVRRSPKNVIVYDVKAKRRPGVTLRTGPKQLTYFTVGPLVLLAYVAKPTPKHIYAAYKDGDPFNPRLDNMYWSETKPESKK